MNFTAPTQAYTIVDTLERNGFSAYLVGGCVRDLILGREPSDWDIATSARPEQVISCFRDYQVVEVGLQHGTVTVLVDHKPFEVTTFRIDGAYSDNRRPDNVTFTDDLREDLTRRDFTINAMAYHLTDSCLYDYHEGLIDLQERHRIACVGDAATRFGEDALRILRAVRFASTLGFSIEPSTHAAMEELCPLLQNVAAERIRVEFSKTLLGCGVSKAFVENRTVLRYVLPELSGCHAWQALMDRVSMSPLDVVVRLALLLGCDGYGEEAAGRANAILTRLRYDNATRTQVERLVRYHDADIPATEAGVRRWLNRLGLEDFRLLLALRQIDFAGEQQVLVTLLGDILARKDCYRLQDLAINGADLMEVGVPEGKEVGIQLKRLLDEVIEGTLPNRRDVLLEAVRESF